MKKRHPMGLLHPLVREFVIRYRSKKKYPYSSYIDVADCLEILIGTPAFHKESILSGTYNFTLELREVQIGWDGTELIDILLYYLQSYILDRVKHTQILQKPQQ